MSLRSRKAAERAAKGAPEDVNPPATGRTPSGETFQIPQTHDVLSGLFNPSLSKSIFDIAILFSLVSQVLLWLLLPTSVARYGFMGYFIFWRLAYNLGLGLLLNQQSRNQWIVNQARLYGWFDADRRPRSASYLKRELTHRMGSDYDFDSMPLEFNVWLAFRHLADVILLNDFVAYCLCAFSWYSIPQGHSLVSHLLRWLVGIALIVFNLVVKLDAHRVVQDLAWYWADCFMQVKTTLVFDGVFEMAPHPMYSIGYSGFYGLSLIVGSQVILFLSLAAHLCQFAFLNWFENPHIERTYGARKPLTDRGFDLYESSAIREADSLSNEDTAESRTPEQTLGDSATESSVKSTREALVMAKSHPSSQALSRHELHNRYFQQELVGLYNWDFLRARDAAIALAFVHVAILLFAPRLSDQTQLILAVGNSVLWRIVHPFGLGLILKRQSTDKWFVRHFVKHYYYPREDVLGPVDDAFRNWTGLYNISLGMSYLSFVGLAWRCYHLPNEWNSGTTAIRHTFGVLLIALHVWTAKETFAVLGQAGWFYADFFLESLPKTLLYTGIYRFLNNPERITGGAAFFGLALLSGSRLVVLSALLSFLCHLWFLSFVENPHMQKLYGDAMRKDSGFTKSMRKVAHDHMDRTPQELRKAVKDLGGTFEKMYEGTSGLLEELISMSTPKMTAYVADTRSMLVRQKQEIVTKILATKPATLDFSGYSLQLLHSPGSKPRKRFHIGDSILLSWTATVDHPANDWIGLYPVLANDSQEITSVGSRGRWTGVRGDAWQGDLFLAEDSHVVEDVRDARASGTVEFYDPERLPPTVGIWEARYHYGGKHFVAALSESFEIYVESPANPNSHAAIYKCLMSIFGHCLKHDPAALPRSAVPPVLHSASARQSIAAGDPDDFVLFSQSQAQMIAYCIRIACEVEVASEVVVASSNMRDLATRILEARRILMGIVPVD